MIEQIRALPMMEKIPLFLALTFWLIAYLAHVLRQPAVDSKSMAKASRQLRVSHVLGLLSLACAVVFCIVHFS